MNNKESPQLHISEQEGGFEIAENRHEALLKINKTFRKRLIERFGEGGTEEEMPFHNLAHSEGVAHGAVEILKAIQKIDPALVSDEDIEFAYTVGLGHDLVQKATLKDGVMRTRHRGFEKHNKDNLEKWGASVGNEEATAIEIWEEMKKYKDPKGNFLFPENEFRKRVFEAIAVTYPELPKEFVAQLPPGALTITEGRQEIILPHIFEKAIKFFQPELTEKSSLVAFAIAQVDLRGPCGAVENPLVFQKQGDAEFHELQSKAIVAEANKGIENISPERRVVIAKDIIDWFKSQVGFVLWQKVLFQKALNENLAINTHKKENDVLHAESPHVVLKKDERAEKIKTALNTMFSYFDSNVLAAYDRYERAENEFGKKIEEKLINPYELDDLLRNIRVLKY
ncbi:MAG: hypothetical protein HYT27_00060 [Parcubacteria group bacterium]|nr:hypothetical protein [Parcubacteria group bacterium]